MPSDMICPKGILDEFSIWYNYIVTVKILSPFHQFLKDGFLLIGIDFTSCLKGLFLKRGSVIQARQLPWHSRISSYFMRRVYVYKGDRVTLAQG